MAPKPKAKTEEKAKGLIGLEKGKKVEGAAYSVGNYKGKTLNLSKKELGKAGQKAAAARTVDISKTKYEGKKVLGPGGKPLTGSVDLGGGNIAVYKNGVRVRAQKPKPAPVPRSGGATSARGQLPAGTTGKDKPKGGGTGAASGGVTLSPRQQAAARRGEAAARRSGRTYANGRPGASAFTASTIRGTGMAPSRPNSRPGTSSAKPKEGERRTTMQGRKKVVEVYRGGRWLPLTGSRGGY